MKKNKFEIKEGDIFFIEDIKYGKKIFPFNNAHRIGKIVYISNVFKNMIGFIPSKDTYDSISSYNSQLIEFIPYVIYTADSEIKKGGWPILDYKEVTKNETLLTKRRVANTIMIKDQELRICTEDDYNKYKNQGIAGFGAVHYLLTNLDKVINSK
ncbi:hypothetical protein E4T80_12180 [Muribacter muris]|uniref:Uncharacterized protein n=1 Tax=Muribacter muris TaxID=67855 RepID=A0A4Y9JP54_9PAST|nr:hypothetical protein [Muribacter muris]MBF0786221.1 hypothetical protein [Muribacter muris]MBF0826357.1 hypothetical protein [Muribacter muris]TFV07491.1 hypothetical protein E4T80_12180 [Muribacter muris]